MEQFLVLVKWYLFKQAIKINMQYSTSILKIKIFSQCRSPNPIMYPTIDITALDRVNAFLIYQALDQQTKYVKQVDIDPLLLGNLLLIYPIAYYLSFGLLQRINMHENFPFIDWNTLTFPLFRYHPFIVCTFITNSIIPK